MGMFGTFGSEQAAVRPLHRLTPLRDDPALAWLSTGETMRIDALGWFLWAAFVVVMFVVRQFARALIFIFVGPFFTGRVSYIVVGGLAAALAPGARRSILRIKNERIEKLLRRQADEVAADDWTALEHEPNDRIVSIVGWVRGRQQLDKPIGGERAVGVALPCQHNFPGVFESLHDFDLVDEEGRTIFIQASEGRLFGAPNVALDSQELRLLYAGLGIPSGATPSGWQVHCLRDGDPVMVVGAKQTVMDPGESSLRGPAPRASLASASPRPLLIFSIPAERRPV
ncbi:MAG TPA: hypothetical protein VH853_05420 [Polyangia bacterium]|nr:hypothetical protein [Polyangia bacterium]